jgi:hypothetical protein
MFIQFAGLQGVATQTLLHACLFATRFLPCFLTSPAYTAFDKRTDASMPINIFFIFLDLIFNNFFLTIIVVQADASIHHYIPNRQPGQSIVILNLCKAV